MSTFSITWAWGTHQEILFDPETDVLDFGWMGSQYFTISEVNGSVVIDVIGNQHSYTLVGVTLDDLSLANVTAKDTTALDAWSAVLDTGATTTITWAWNTDTVVAFDPTQDKLDFNTLAASDFVVGEANGSVIIYLPANQHSYILEGVSLSELSLSNIVSQDAGALAEWSAVLAAGAAATQEQISGSTAITWNYGVQAAVDFDPATDTLDFGSLSASDFSIAEVNGSVMVIMAGNAHSYTLEGVSLADLTLANVVALDSGAFTEWNAALAADAAARGVTLVPVTWDYGSQTVLDFDPATDKLDFGWVSASDFTLMEVNGSVVILMPGNLHSYTLEGVSLADLSAANILTNNSSTYAEWAQALEDGVTTPTEATASTAITVAWDSDTLLAFDPATDALDFQALTANDFTVSEVNGSVVVYLPASQQAYVLDGVSLSDLTMANITGGDASAQAEWAGLVAPAPEVETPVDPGTSDPGTTDPGSSDPGDTDPGTGEAATFTLTAAFGAQQVLDFDPASDTLDFGTLAAGDFTVAELDGSVVVFLPASAQSYTLAGVTLADLGLDNIAAQDSGSLAEWSALLASGGTGTVAADATSDTVVAWAWNTNTVLDFDPASDVLDFQYMTGDDFEVAEVNGSVVIYILSNQQTYVLDGVSLSDLSMDNIAGHYASAMVEWADLVSAGSSDAVSGSSSDALLSSTAPVSDEPLSAAAWLETQVYVGGDRASVGNVVYEAKWWTQGSDPETDHGANGSGHVWTVVGYLDTTPVVSEAPDDLVALTTTETSTVLSWDAPEVKGVGTISGYAIYEDGELIATTSDRSYKVSGLDADTTYHFTVVAIDEAGASEASTPLSVTTEAAGSDGPDGQYYSPYVAMWLPESTDLVQMVDDAGLSAVTLAFVVGTGDGQIGWASVSDSLTDDTLSNGTSISDMVSTLQAQGVDVSISFGGGSGEEPALYFDNAADLTAAYQSVIDTYHVTSLDFDVEGSALTDDEASALRNAAIVALQEDNPDLQVSFTLPVLPTGLTQDGLDLLADAAAAGVEIDTVNVMVMDYGTDFYSGDMGDDAIAATEATIAQLEALGIDAQVGITPMAGINDVTSEVFTLEDAQQLVDYADGNDHVAYLAMWALNRDQEGVEGRLLDDASGVAQNDYDFSKIFATV